ncbi:cupredoxin domain-containing protein [Chondromyces crocatus]|uniref:Blue (type 1) copper domain-containing protein n=1 Tax=Chondromyces crocatus TaxID=52 RepID=A0A0K1E937_CHOCO|nr:plastocyanin/azurin family copper-binding protein [Chondromyces crocatus]AKT37369.1 uncharacterized protein CMC5_015040 [Chondromyces crocatus]
MKLQNRLGLLGAAGLLVMAMASVGCSDDDGSSNTGGGGGAGGGTTTTTTTTDTNAGGAGGTGGAGGEGGTSGEGGAGGEGGGASAVNGCAPETAEDRTGEAAVSVAFGGGLGQVYSPKCVTVSVGTVVTFTGSFQNHPLQGGVVENGSGEPATTGPFATVTNSGNSKAVTLDDAGTYPYYCVPHAQMGMTGVVYVVP